MSATRLKLVTDENGISRWYKRASGELFVQCAYEPRIESYDFCAGPPDLPVISSECGVEVFPPPPIASSNPSTWPPINSSEGGGNFGSESSSSSFSSESSVSSISSISSVSSFPSSEGSNNGSGSGGGGSSVVSSTPSLEDCPPISWVFATVNTSSNWVENNDRDLDFRVEASDDCGGSNFLEQSGTAIGTITVPPGKIATLTYELVGTVESEDLGFDNVVFNIDAVLIELIESAGNAGGCVPLEVTRNGVQVLAAGVHTLEVIYDTVDGAFHTDQFGVAFRITDCFLSDVP